MEAVLAHVEPLVQVEGQRVHVRLRRHCLVERRVEHRHLLPPATCSSQGCACAAACNATLAHVAQTHVLGKHKPFPGTGLPVPER